MLEGGGEGSATAAVAAARTPPPLAGPTLFRTVGLLGWGRDPYLYTHSFSGGPDAFSQALQRQSPLPSPSLPAPPSRGASLGGQWQERGNKVDTRQITAMLPMPSTERRKGEKWSQETCSPDSNCLCSSYSSTWKHLPEATLPLLFPNTKHTNRKKKRGQDLVFLAPP